MKNEQKVDIPANNFLALIEAGIEGLIYISESDSDWQLYDGGKVEKVSKEAFGKIIKADASAIEERPFDEFFERLGAAKEWHGEKEKGRAERYRKLGALLGDALEDIRVFRVGKIRIDIYVVGKNKDGNLAGIKTFAIET